MKPVHRVSEVIVVEGRYDKNTLSQTVDAVIIETSGFGVFNDREKQQLLRTLAEKRGLIVLTDSEVLNAVTPDILGKERRKAKASKEGKLGVEGMSPEVLLNALRRAGATIDGAAAQETEPISMADMYHAGLTGKPDSAMRRERLLSGMELPKKMTAAALLPVLNALMSREEFLRHNY